MKCFAALCVFLIGVYSQDKVDVVFLLEAGCPYCQAAVGGVVDTMVKAEGLSDIIDVAVHPFGNNYFTTQTCGGGGYSSDVRHCWAKLCVNTTVPGDDCFSGTIVTQHGDNERQVNRMLACAITVQPKWEAHWPFFVCMEAKYTTQYVKAAQTCASNSGLDYTALARCYNGLDGDAALVREAKATVDHPGTPAIYVNGALLDDENTVFSAVCAAYTGAKPAGCANSTSIISSPVSPFSRPNRTALAGSCPAGTVECDYAAGQSECCTAGENCIPKVGCRC